MIPGAGARVLIIEPSGVPDAGALAANVSMMRAAGLVVDHRPCRTDGPGRASADCVSERGAILAAALAEPDVAAVFAARGGYGASDLLAGLDWNALAARSPVPLVGFSDISVLHSALLARLGWPGVHGPMPGSRLWSREGPDTARLLSIILGRQPWRGTLALSGTDGGPAAAVDGWLFGGCLSVLTNLIGTPYMPASMDGAILFFEDINETPERLLRHWNQWCQSGLATGVRAVVVGSLRDGRGEPIAEREHLLVHLAERTQCPVFASDEFGHQSLNQPLVVGAPARIADSTLHWHLDEGFRLDRAGTTAGGGSP
jgi:muramoyltetrapeptide carboxypeptidase